MRTIQIRELMGSPDILNRIYAHDISNAARNSEDSSVQLDFTGIQFTTRSFMDEFYNEMKKLKTEKSIQFIGMSDDLKAMYSAVSRTQKGVTKVVTMKPYAKPKSIDELESIFNSLSI